MGTGNTFGKLFRITTFGESHGTGVGVIVDGCPPRLPLSTEDVQRELDRRKPGQSRLTTPRDEEDLVEIMSGTYNGITLGTPIGMVVRNKDQRSKDYDEMAAKYRPSHADATYDAKYGVRAVAGGGRSSARETIGRVAAGAVAKKILKLYSGVEIVGYVQAVQDVELLNVDHDAVTEEMVEANIARCPDPVVAEKMISRIDEIRLVNWLCANFFHLFNFFLIEFVTLLFTGKRGTVSAGLWKWSLKTFPAESAHQCLISSRQNSPRLACLCLLRKDSRLDRAFVELCLQGKNTMTSFILTQTEGRGLGQTVAAEFKVASLTVKIS